MQVPVLVVVAAMSMVVVVVDAVAESTFRLSSRDWNEAVIDKVTESDWTDSLHA